MLRMFAAVRLTVKPRIISQNYAQPPIICPRHELSVQT